MARSTYIYVLKNGHGDILMVATVKHEMQTYLRGWGEDNYGKGHWQVTRWADGKGWQQSDQVDKTAVEFMVGGG